MKDPPESENVGVWSEFAIFSAGCWIAVAFILSPLFGVHWLTRGDFKYTTAMYYHGLMVPVLVLFYLLTVKILSLKMLNRRIYAAGSILSILFVGIGSIFNFEKGLSVAAVIQITGMVITDILGIALVLALMVSAMTQNEEVKKIKAAFYLLVSSIVAILVAAPLGHLSGWAIDLGISSFPGVTALLQATGMKPGNFQDGLVSSHSHLIVAATLCGLVAIAAIRFGYQSLTGWKRRVSTSGLWMILISILLATIIYIISALFGWEPPTFFTSGPNGVNGIPIDDLVLIFGETGFLVLMVGLFLAPVQVGRKYVASFKLMNRMAIFLNWIFGFLGAVVWGLYIEFNETFYGAGIPPASGALNDQVFIRAHLLYAFFLLPIIFSILFAVDFEQNQYIKSRTWLNGFSLMCIFGMTLGLIGEFLWIRTFNKGIFLASIFVMGTALIAGGVNLWPGRRYSLK